MSIFYLLLFFISVQTAYAAENQGSSGTLSELLNPYNTHEFEFDPLENLLHECNFQVPLNNNTPPPLVGILLHTPHHSTIISNHTYNLPRHTILTQMSNTSLILLHHCTILFLLCHLYRKAIEPLIHFQRQKYTIRPCYKLPCSCILFKQWI